MKGNVCQEQITGAEIHHISRSSVKQMKTINNHAADNRPSHLLSKRVGLPGTCFRCGSIHFTAVTPPTPTPSLGETPPG